MCVCVCVCVCYAVHQSTCTTEVALCNVEQLCIGQAPYQLLLSLLQSGSDVDHEVELLLMRSMATETETATAREKRVTVKE